jgi:hypothetical protein
VLELLSRDESPTTMLSPLAGLTAVAVAILAGAFLAVHAVIRRLDD